MANRGQASSRLRASVLSATVLAVTVAAARIGVPGQVSFVTDGTARTFFVNRTLLVVGTDSVYLDGRLLGQDEYLFDYPRRTVMLEATPGPWQVVCVTFRYVPMKLSDSPGSLRVVKEPAEPVPDTGSRVVAMVDTSSSDLRLSGGKTLGVSVGGVEGSGIDQTTRLAVNGTVEGIDVSAELSDQSSGIPAEGTTRELDELDRVLVSLKAPRWQVQAGDVDLGLSFGDFGAVSRRALGVSAGGGARGFEAGAAYVTPRGQYGHVALGGTDGLQGPYLLAPDQRSAQLVAGSEEVWLDGVKLVRGWDEDYTIDYSTGELSFTSRHVISSRSRIEADFQYVTGAYERATVSGSASYRPAGFEFEARVFREGDDASENLIEELTDADRQYLAGIGADTSQAWLEGGQYVGEGHGDYVGVGDHYQYAGQGMGDWQVRFTLVGDSLGDYRFDNVLQSYGYVGPGAGNYVAKMRVDLPERQDIGYARAGFRREGLYASAAGAARHHARNLFAAGGAGRDAGALCLAAGWADSSVSVRWTRRMQQAGFELPGQRAEPDFAYRWGGAVESLRRTSDEVAAGLRRGVVVLGAEAGRMSVSGPAEVVRYGGSVDIGPVGLEAGQAGSITRLRIEAQPELGPWTPRAGWRSEAGTAARDRVASGGLGLSQGERLSAELGCERTFSDETLAGQWRQRNVGNLARAHLDWSPSAAYRLGAGGAYQDRRFALAGGDDWSQVLGDISGSATPRAGIQVQASLGQSHKRVQLRDEVFRYVGPNQGEYRLDSLSGEYFADPDGDYERVTVATGRFAATREWTGTGSADVSAWEPAALYGSYSRTQARAEGSTLTELAHGSARFVVREFASVVTPTLEYTGDDAQDNTVAGAGRASQSRRWSVELHSDRLPELETRLRGTLSRQEEARGGTGMNSLETGWRLEGQPVVGSRLRLEVLLALERQALARADVPAGLVLVGREVTLGRTTGIGARTRLRTSAGLVWRSANQTSVPFDVSLGRPVGLVPRLEVEYGHTFSDVLSATARYGFQNRPDRPAEHSFAAEMQARF